MNQLAQNIYDLLRALPVPRQLLTYGDLVTQLRAAHPGRYATLSPRQNRLHQALGDVVRHCHGLQPPAPALSALVVRQSAWIPGYGYYGVAHNLSVNTQWVACVAAWAAEAHRAETAVYP